MNYEYKIVYKKGVKELTTVVSSKDDSIKQARILCRLGMPVRVYELEFLGKELSKKRLIFESTED
jgi:hypothetical protein